MRTSTLLYSLLAMGAGRAIAASMAHNHAAAHKRMHEIEADVEEEVIVKRGASHLNSGDLAHLTSLGFISGGKNLETPCENVWIGKDGPYTNKFINRSGAPVTLVVWGSAGSWVNANQPDITVSIPAGKKKTLSFANTANGAFAVVGPNTKLENGQVCDTWGEFTFGQYGTVDVSREVNMSGRKLSIIGPKCTTDMDRCVFVCPPGQNSCWKEYDLKNCAVGSQEGANYGTDYLGMPSGGCSGMGDSAHLRTIIGA